MTAMLSVGCFGTTAAEEPAVAAYLLGGDVSHAKDFPGAAGGGWQDGWVVTWPREYQKSLSVSVVNTEPLSDSPYHLEIRSFDEKQRSIAMRRGVDLSVLDLLKPYRVSLKVRLDELENTGVPFSLAVAGEGVGGSGGPATSIWAVHISNNQWFAIGKGEEDPKKLTWKKIPIKVQTATVYTITCEVTPAEGTYRVTITNGSESADSGEVHSVDPEAGTKAASQLLFRVASSLPYIISLGDLKVQGHRAQGTR